MSSLVVVSKGNDPYLTAQKALLQFPLPRLEGKKILIKPNAARQACPGSGMTTHPSVVLAAIDHLKTTKADKIVIAESCIFGVHALKAFRMTEMEKVAKKSGVELIDLDHTRPTEMIIPGGKVLKKIKVSKLLKDFDFVVSIPVMKTHMHTRVTLSIKNMKGLLWRKEKAKLHQLHSPKKITKGDKELDIAISEMASVLFPNLSIIDGTVGMEGMGPAYGKAKKLGMVVVGNNPLSTDAVASRLMGLDPEDIPHLRLSAERGLGEIELNKIIIKPQGYLKWAVPFEPPPTHFSIPFPDVMVYDQGACSACLSTLLVFLQDHYSKLMDYRLSDKKIHIGIGKKIKTCPEGTILIGNCTSKMKGKGIFIQGCPPVASQIMNTLYPFSAQ
ncbi:MAG: DUF362 domain-containing protein [Syntrophaceae bacterium]|nr:DUF362 domain-containing protein [Syntrophaceae bacterium]